MDSIYCCVTSGFCGCSCLLTGGAGHFPRFPQALSVLADYLKRLTMVVVYLPRFLCPPPELFRFIPSRLGGNSDFFGEATVLLRILAAVLGSLSHTLCLLPVL